MSITSADFDEQYNIVDTKTPRHSYMAGIYKQSFAYYTLRERLPVILTGIIDDLNKDKDELTEQYGEECREELKQIIGKISKLKYQLQTDKAFEIFKADEPDKEAWNNFLHTMPKGKNSFYQTCWLYAECYMYRRLYSFFESSQTMKTHDYFARKKENATLGSLTVMEEVIKCTRNLSKNEEAFRKILKISLWANRFDLSLSVGNELNPAAGSPCDAGETYKSNLLVDSSDKIWECISQPAENNKAIIVDVICDNAGYELFTDFLLGDYLLETGLAAKVRYHVKAIPWFVSDVTPRDFQWAIDCYQQQTKYANVLACGKKWAKYMQDGSMELAPVDYYWTGPFEFFKMRDLNLALYNRLAEARLVIFKGDLNYRKLIGDFGWDDTDDFVKCIRGFLPTHICTLRTIKADLICGLRRGVAEQLRKLKPDWMTTGEFAVIQFAENTYCGCTLDPNDVEQKKNEK